MYEESRGTVAAALSFADYYASTVKIWSSKSTQLYLNLTMHYITSEWKLCSSCCIRKLREILMNFKYAHSLSPTKNALF